MMSVHHLNFVLTDHATPPAGDALVDREIGLRILEAIERRAAERGMKEFKDWRGVSHPLEGLMEQATLGGALRDPEKFFEELVADNGVYGVLPKGTTLETLREKGAVRFANWGMVGHGISQGSTLKPDEVHNPLRWHTEDKIPYDTLVRRAQFYIDHEWFLEAGEELPTHKETPPHGGRNRRFLMTSGHNRWSIHSMNLTNNIIQNTHRGEPFVFLNDGDAGALGVENGEKVRLVSNNGDCLVAVKITPSCRPGQVILYNGFEPYMHENWYSQADLESGHVKHLGFAGGYGHLKYRLFSWQPIPADRAVRVDVEKLD
jgi:anaerobic selenocysteine-containing dehydrogenase